jgi:colicin import membrane protein
MPITLRLMADAKNAEELAAQAAEIVRGVLAEAEEKAAGIIREAEAKAASISETAEADATKARERAEADARAQIEAAKRALDELGGTLAAAASSALPKSETEEDAEPGPDPDPEPEPESPTESPSAPEAPVSPPPGNGDDAGERLVAMKLAMDGKDSAEIEAELVQKFGARDRSELLEDVLSRVPR